MNFAILFLIINLLFFGAVAYYFLIVKKQMQEEKEVEFEHIRVDEQRLEKAENALKEELIEVRSRANSILEESENIAKELIIELENVLGRKHTDTTVDLPAGSDFEFELGNLSNKIKSHYVMRIKNLLTSLEKYELSEAQKVLKFADQQEESTDRNIQKIRVEQLSKLQQRLDKYKEEELSLFDKKVEVVVDQAAAEVIGHLLTNQEHKEAILKALEKAKSQHQI